jgi:hypothetical protein
MNGALRPGVRGALTIARPQGVRAGASRHRQSGEKPMVAHKVSAPEVVECSPRNRLLGDSVTSAKLLRSCQRVLFHGLSTKRRAKTECTQEVWGVEIPTRSRFPSRDQLLFHRAQAASHAPHDRAAQPSLVLLEETTVARKRILNASQPEHMPQRGLRRGDHRFADRLLQRRHHSVRAGVETGND